MPSTYAGKLSACVAAAAMSAVLLAASTGCMQQQQPQQPGSDDAGTENSESSFVMGLGGERADGGDMPEAYGLASDSVFVRTSAESMEKFMEHGTGAIVFGFRDCRACQLYMPLLDGFAKDAGLDEILYYELQDDRKEENDTYRWILSELSGYTSYDKAGDERLFVPALVIEDEGEVVFFDDVTAHMTDEEVEGYWTPEAVSEQAGKLSSPLSKCRDAVAECRECG